MFIQSAIVTKWEICLGTKKLLTLKIEKFRVDYMLVFNSLMVKSLRNLFVNIFIGPLEIIL